MLETKNEGGSSIKLPSVVALVTPPSVFLLDERVFVSLGILKIAAVLEEKGVRVEHLDLSGEQKFALAMRAFLERTTARFVGITVTTPQLPAVVRLIAVIREVRPQMKIILGGPHVTLTHAAKKREIKKGISSRAHEAFQRLESLVDIMVSGDGEKAIIRALQEEAPRFIDGDDPMGDYFLRNEDYEKTPFPARHLVDMKSYRYQIDGRNSTSLIAQLGCPFGCGFCGGRYSKSLRMIRTRSPDSILREIEFLYRTYGYTGFMFYDDELNVNKGLLDLLKSLSRLQEKLGVEFRFRGFIKSQLFTKEQAEALYTSGFRWILSGFESGSEKILKNMNKKATLSENTRAMEFAHDAGLKVKALMSVGHPGEDPKSVEETKQWLLKVRPEEFDCTIITTYPGTPYYDDAVPHRSMSGVWTYTCDEFGDLLHALDVDFQVVADYYKGDPHGGYQSFVFTEALSASEIVQARNEIEAQVRNKLNLPYPSARDALHFDHSMGQGAPLPSYLLQTSQPCGMVGNQLNNQGAQIEL